MSDVIEIPQDRYIHLGGGCSFVHTGDSDTYRRIMEVVGKTLKYPSGDYALIHLLNKRPDCWAWDPYTESRFRDKDVVVHHTSIVGHIDTIDPDTGEDIRIMLNGPTRVIR